MRARRNNLEPRQIASTALKAAAGAVGVGLVMRRQHRQQLAAAEARAEAAEKKAKIEPASELLNRRALEEAYVGLQGTRNRRRSDQPEAPHSLAMLDMDNFKKINERYKQSGGDAVFKQVGAAINNQVRERDVVARLGGGDEIAILLPRVGLEKALEISEDVRAGVESDTIVTASVGVTELDLNKSLRENLDLANEALIIAKQQGRNQVVAYAVPEQGPVQQTPPAA